MLSLPQGSSLLQKLEQQRDAGFCYGVLPLAPTVMPLGFILQGSAAVCVTWDPEQHPAPISGGESAGVRSPDSGEDVGGLTGRTVMRDSVFLSISRPWNQCLSIETRLKDLWLQTLQLTTHASPAPCVCVRCLCVCGSQRSTFGVVPQVLWICVVIWLAS